MLKMRRVIIEIWDILDKYGYKTGRQHERGKPMQPDEYRLVVRICIVNNKNEFLIAKGPNQTWGIIGGAALTGENSLTAVIRESKEELGILLEPENGQLFKRHCEPQFSHGGGAWIDVWLFRQEIEIHDIFLCPDETYDVKWASPELIKQLSTNGIFLPIEKVYPYLNEVFEFCDASKQKS